MPSTPEELLALILLGIFIIGGFSGLILVNAFVQAWHDEWDFRRKRARERRQQ